MNSAICKAIVATLAIGAVHALPQQSVEPTPIQSSEPTPNVKAPVDNSELIAKLKTDATATKRFQRLLTNNGESLLSDEEIHKATLFDFEAHGVVAPGNLGGKAAIADISSAPILLGSGITTTVATLNPCGFIVPHVHPRANEYTVVLEGEIVFSWILENSILNPPAKNPQFNGKAGKHVGVLFPQGAIHWGINNAEACEPATAIVTLASDDPGLTPVLINGISAGNTSLIRRADDGLDGLRAVLPEGIVKAADECLARCGSKKF